MFKDQLFMFHITMEAVDKRKIRANYLQLVRNLNPEDVTDYLYQEGVLTEEDIERIMAEPVRAQKVRVLLSILPLRRKEGLTKLLEAMKESGYCELVDKIEGTVYIEEQPGINKNKELTKSVLNLHLVELKDQLEEQSQFVKALQCEIEEDQELMENLAGTIIKEKSTKKELVEKVYNAAQQEMHAELEDASLDTVTAPGLVGEVEYPTATATVTNHPIPLKCVVVGGGLTGISYLLSRYIYDIFPGHYIPTVFDNYETTKIVMHNNISTIVKIDFYDTPGQDDYDRLRPLSYPGTDVVLILFSHVKPWTLPVAIEKYLPEIQHHLPGVPYILVGTMVDLYNDKETINWLEGYGRKVIKEKNASMVARAHNFAGSRVFVTSALTPQGINKLMDFMIHTGLEYKSRGEVKQSRRKKRCSIL